MQVLKARIRDHRGATITKHLYWCEGCNCLHALTLWPDMQRNGAFWRFSGTIERPTYSPSQLSITSGYVCHTEIKDGMVEFLPDCTHAMRGKRVPLPSIPAWAVDRLA